MKEFDASDPADQINDLITDINYLMKSGVYGLSSLTIEELEEVQRHMGLIIEQGIFWLKEQNENRYVYDLRNFLSWLCNFLEERERA